MQTTTIDLEAGTISVKDTPPPKTAAEKLAQLNAHKACKWEEIKQRRDSEENSDFVYNGMLFDGGEKSKSRIRDTALKALVAKTEGNPFTVYWTLANDEVVELNADEIIGVSEAIWSSVNGAFIAARQLREALDAAQTLQEVNDIKWNI